MPVRVRVDDSEEIAGQERKSILLTYNGGSFTGAAQELGVTAAAVGQLVRSLEAWVGHPLLNRTCTGKERLTLVDEARETVLSAVKAPEGRESRLHINSTSAVILAALSGHGVAIVRRALVSQLIETGQLVQLHPDHRWPLKWSYYVVTPQQAVMRREVKIFHDWLVQDVIASSGQSRAV